MPDPFTNARPYFDVSFPTSGDSFSISGFRNNFAGLGFLDVIPLQPRAHNPADKKIMIRGRDASSFYNPVYYGDANQRTPFSSGDSATMNAPVTSPRIDIVYMTPSGDLGIVTGTEAATPTLPTLAPSGDSRFPICAVYHKTTMTKIVNFEDKDSNSGDSYIYQDLRPWMRTAGAGSAKLTAVSPLSVTGDNAVGTAETAARADHTHKGVTAVRKVGSANLFGVVEFAGPITQGIGRLTFPEFVAFAARIDGANQSINDVTATKVNFNNEVFDTHNAYDSVSLARFTVPAGQAGRYLISAQIGWDSPGTNKEMQISIYVDGSEIRFESGITVNTSRFINQVTAMADLAVGQYVEIYAYHTSGAAETIGASVLFDIFTMVRVG